MSSPRLPPLYPLRAFEAAARLSSFTLAAEELSISQSAVSHHVKTLEGYFGAPLFFRATGMVRLTAEGMRVYSACQAAFEQLYQINERVPEDELKETLTLSSPPLFFNWWLVPRLHQFAEQHPRVNFRFLQFSRGMKLTPNELDVAIIWGRHIPEGFVGRTLLQMEYCPVAHPRVARTLPESLRPDLLSRLPLLHLYDHSRWGRWLERVGCPVPSDLGGWVFEDPGMLLESARNGYGIALGPVPILEPAFERGELVRVFGSSVGENTYYLGLSVRSLHKPAIRRLWNWFMDEELPHLGGSQEKSAQ